ncbi:uncharacterized protein AtWU_05640 [Aspergillus tubingensis]|uniref:uncharacterized protein n=1 Tax=Aspergillus tubingensis TaxID=5068 RepID=UPI0015789B57|nr:uncharacterized protein AtWU_05640 [Aspergillus tubingensis]GFN15839.1 hypothetical protein AtWU_05640 [Aspergillus tubingensis]
MELNECARLVVAEKLPPPLQLHPRSTARATGYWFDYLRSLFRPVPSDLSYAESESVHAQRLPGEGLITIAGVMMKLGTSTAKPAHIEPCPDMPTSHGTGRTAADAADLLSFLDGSPHVS